MEYAHFGSLRTILRASRGVGRKVQNAADLIVQLKRDQLSGSHPQYAASPIIDAMRVPKVKTQLQVRIQKAKKAYPNQILMNHAIKMA